MLFVAAYSSAAIFVVYSILCYLYRFWHFQNIKDFRGAFPVPIIMDGVYIRNSKNAVQYVLSCGKKCAHKFRGWKLSIVIDNFLLLLLSEDISFVMNSLELISKGKDYRVGKSWIGDGLLVSTGKKWTQRRKLITPTFHFSILRDFVPTFEAIGDVLIELLLEKSKAKPIDVSRMLSLYSLDVISETALGVSVDAQRNENHEYVVAVHKMANLFTKRVISWWRRIEFLYQFSFEYKQFNSLCDWVHNYTFNIIEKRRQTLTDFDDDLIDSNGVRKKIAFLDMLIKSTIDGVALSNEDIREEVDTFMFGGQDTSASALQFSLYCLSQHPEIQDKLFEEQKDILGDAVHATYDDLQKMVYLEMFIKEVLRLYPSVPIIGRDVKENMSSEFGTLKQGLQVVLVPMITHRHPGYFAEPEKFDPERFSVENIKNIKPFSYIPFSGGYRNCIGQKFAMLSLKSTISKIVRNFKIHPDPTYKPILCIEIVLKTSNGVWVIFEKRN